jgi:hypothetical protein
VQNFVDLHWPGITELKNIKRIEGWKGVYSGVLDGHKVAVKSVTYEPIYE